MPFTLATNLSYSVFLTTSFFTTLLNLAKSPGTGVNYQYLIYLPQFLNLILVHSYSRQCVIYF